MPTLVMKFGGTSVGTAEAIGRVAGITAARRAAGPVLLVVSAMHGVTDLLLDGARQAAGGVPPSPEALRARHLDALSAVTAPGPDREATAARVTGLLAEYAALCHAIAVLGEASPRALDAIGALGERLSAPIVAAALRASGTPAEPVEATAVVVTDATFGEAVPDAAATRARAGAVLGPMLAAGTVPVVTGFIGATASGVTTTLGRGGSDFSAAILGAALDAGAVWIWTDVPGVMTADPRVVPEARTIPELSFSEISELAYFGAKVLHPKTIRPVVERGIELRIKSTFAPDHPGTLILPAPRSATGAVKAVTAIAGQHLVVVEGRGMLGVPGVAARTFAAVAATGASVSFITQASSEQSICFTVPARHAAAIVAALEAAFRAELERRDIERVSTLAEVVIVTVVGDGFRGTPGVSGRIFTALGAAGVNVIAIAQGSSECSISMLVGAHDAERAVRTLHTLTEEGA